MKRNIVTVTTLGIPDTQSRALVAATTVIQSRLPAELDWSPDAARADILILNTGDASGCDLASRFVADNEAVIVPYSEHGDCLEHGISRPLRMPGLQAALAHALQAVLERAPRGGEEIQRRSYRGQAVADKPSGRSKDRTPKTRMDQRVYRGSSS